MISWFILRHSFNSVFANTTGSFVKRACGVCQLWVISTHFAEHYTLNGIRFKPKIHLLPVNFELSVLVLFRLAFNCSTCILSVTRLRSSKGFLSHETFCSDGHPDNLFSYGSINGFLEAVLWKKSLILLFVGLLALSLVLVSKPDADPTPDDMSLVPEWRFTRAVTPISGPEYYYWTSISKAFSGWDLPMENWPRFRSIFGIRWKNRSPYYTCEGHQVNHNTPRALSAACDCFLLNGIFSRFGVFPHLCSRVGKTKRKHYVLWDITQRVEDNKIRMFCMEGRMRKQLDSGK